MFEWIEAHPGTAAWVQGLGTLLAIIAAASIALWQVTATRRDEARRAEENLRGRRQAAAVVAETVARFVGQFSGSVGDKAQLQALPHIRSIDRALQGYNDELVRIPLGDLRDEILCQRILVMRSQLGNVLEMIENLRAYLKRGGSAEDEIGARVDAIGSSGAAVVKAAEEFQERLQLIGGA